MIETRKSIEAERAVLVGVALDGQDLSADQSLDELASLVEAAGGQPVGRVVQRRHAPDPATYIGRGKVEEVAALKATVHADVIVFDNELSPAQIRELEEATQCRVIDRSELILDIFASRARTREAQVQVELAQLQYTAPRLRGMWTHLERQAGTGGGMGAGAGGAGGMGGMGTRGPGEKQIEIDRRIVSKRISRLKDELHEIDARKVREVRARNKEHFTVGLVGYTNAGKSTLMNTLTGAGTYAADQLFATLDTKTRRWHLEAGVDVMLSDTVGFVRNLPHNLVASFKATLEEAIHADLLLHVIDTSHPHVETQIEAVEGVLKELGVDAGKIIPVLNKVDAVTDGAILPILGQRYPQSVAVSALTGKGLSDLCERVLARRRRSEVLVSLSAPIADGKVQAFARAHGQIHTERYDDTHWHADVSIPRQVLDRFYELQPDLRVRENATVGV